jgi:hypothetical protein
VEKKNLTEEEGLEKILPFVPKGAILAPDGGPVESDKEQRAKALSRKIATISHLHHPVLINPDGSTRVIKLHKFRGLTDKQIEDLLKGDFDICKLAEIDGHYYALVYLIQPKRMQPNLIGSCMLQDSVLGPCMLVAESHADFNILFNKADGTRERLMEIKKQKEEKSNGGSDDGDTSSVLDK